MDKRNINLDRKSGITGLNAAEMADNEAKLASNAEVDSTGALKNVTVNAIHTEIDPVESDFVVCAYCGGKNLKSFQTVVGGANATSLQDVANPLNIGAPTTLGNNNRCGYCGENPINPARSDVPKYDYGNGKTEQSI